MGFTSIVFSRWERSMDFQPLHYLSTKVPMYLPIITITIIAMGANKQLQRSK